MTISPSHFAGTFTGSPTVADLRGNAANTPKTLKSAGLAVNAACVQYRVVSKSKLDKNVAVQADHEWPNISSASSP